MSTLLILMLMVSWSLVLKSTAAIVYNPLITNGTCYFKAGEQMADEYSPCGNAALSNYWCCQLGDACASENACFNFGTGTTYLAGCTDPDYEDTACPDKGLYTDQQWTGLVRCDISDDFSEQQELWASCEDDEQPLVVMSNLSRSCQCDKDNPDYTTAVVFTAGPGLVNYATLPEKKGKSIMWAAGMAPSTFEFSGSATASSMSTASRGVSSSSNQTSTKLSRSSSSTITSSSASQNSTFSYIAPTSESTQSPQSKAGFSTGLKVGIAMSVLGAILGIIGVGCFMSWFVRKRRAGKSHPENVSEICGYSGEGSQCDNKDGSGEPTTQYTTPKGGGGDILNGHPTAGTPVLDGDNAMISANLDGTRSPRRDNRDSSVSASAVSFSAQDGRSSMYMKDGNHLYWPSPVSTIKSQEQMYQYQPYRPNELVTQHTLPEIAELPASESLSRGVPSTRIENQLNGDDEMFPHNSTTAHSIDESNEHAGNQPSHGFSARSQEVHELPG